MNLQYAIPALDRASRLRLDQDDRYPARKTPEGSEHFRLAARGARAPCCLSRPNKVTDEVAQLHLEHPVVQRLLQRFLSQGFVHDDLSRRVWRRAAIRFRA